MRYRALLLDADDTIFDFVAAEARAIGDVIAFAGIGDARAAGVYSEINKGYWRKLEKGEVTTAELRVARFRDFASFYGVPIEAEVLADTFVRALSRQRELIPGALEAVAEIAAQMPVAIVTNGIAEVQHSRFDESPIMRHVSAFIISGEVGFQKPDPRIVFSALDRLGARAEDALLVGDGLASDIPAAERAGVDACWYNPKKLARPDGARIKYEIEDIRELPRIALAE
jgi:YjjG family noncanonical pyrimidine nucleotidase